MQKLLRLFNQFSDSFLKYGLAAILLAVPLYPKFPFLRIPGTYVSIRLEDFLIAVVSLIAFIYFLPKIREILTKKLERSMILFLLIGLLSLISAIFITQTIVPYLGILHWIRRIEYFLPFFIGFFYLRSRNNDKDLLEFFLKILMVVVVIAFIYGFGQKYLNWPVIITQNEEYSKGIALRWVPGSHINSTFAGHYDLATFLILLLPIFISLFFIIPKKLTKIILLGVIFSGLWLLVNAVSRISIVSYLLATGLALFLLKRYKEIIVVFLISIVFFGFSSDLLARYTQIIEVTYKRIFPQTKLINLLPRYEVYAQELPLKRLNTATPTPTPVPVFEDRSTSIRLNVEWPRAIRAFTKSPLLGTGYSSITLATDNDFLRLLGEIGILGFFAFILILLRLGKLFKKALPLNKNFEDVKLAFMAGMYGAFVGVLLNALFIDVFEASKFAIILWLLMGFAVSMARSKINE
jgi:hypothetical protein